GSGITNPGRMQPGHSDGNPTTGISAWWKPSPRFTMLRVTLVCGRVSKNSWTYSLTRSSIRTPATADTTSVTTGPWPTAMVTPKECEYGLDLEASWLIVEAAQRVGRPQDA